MARVVAIPPEEVEGMIRRWMLALGDDRQISAVQIVVDQPFGDGMRVHNEVPGFNILLLDR